MNNYCMHCGSASPPGSKFCNQCGKKFGTDSTPKKSKEKQSDILPQPGAKPNKKRYPKEAEEGDSGVLSKKGRRYSPGRIFPPPNPDEEIIDDDDDGTEGEDIDYIPDIDKLEIEPVEPLPRPGETWASIVQQAEMDKRRGI